MEKFITNANIKMAFLCVYSRARFSFLRVINVKMLKISTYIFMALYTPIKYCRLFTFSRFLVKRASFLCTVKIMLKFQIIQCSTIKLRKYTLK